jgi:hypothetical protein
MRVAPARAFIIPMTHRVRMTQTDNRPARSNNVVPLPVYGDIYGSLRGAMLFPNDPAKAESFCAVHLMKGPLQNYLRAGHILSVARQIELFNVRDREIASNEIATQERHGAWAGEVIKSLWALICSRPDIASWECAIRVIQNHWGRAGITISRATLRTCLREMRPALHLWGAWALREHQWLDNPNVGYDRIDDLSAFMTEAMTLLQQLCIWRDGRDQPDLRSCSLRWRSVPCVSSPAPLPRKWKPSSAVVASASTR